MKLQKTPRIVNKKLISEVRKLPCVISGGKAEVHHIKSVKSFGPDLLWNLCPLRHDLHMECHRGMNKFAEKYPKFKQWLIDNGWVYETRLNKWKNYK